MCGLVAAFGRVDRALLSRMTDRLRHRGPDGSGVHIAGAGGLGHTRLSLLDLGGGAQPFRSRDGRRHLAFNGEIYNHVALRDELAGRGVRFATRCDTEVVLAAYETWGPRCVERFDGMFAFAVLEEDRLVVARDRFGIKPLFVATPSADGPVLFASEIGALLEHDDVPPRLDARAVFEAAVLGYPLDDRTHFAAIRRVPPGAVLAVTRGGDGTLAMQTLFTLPAPAADAPAAAGPPTDEAVVDACIDALTEQVRLQCLADHPVGVLLSGGLDSSIIATLAARVTPRLHTFTLGTTHDDEVQIAAAVARALGSVHDARLVDFDTCIAALPRTIASLALPSSFSLVESATARMRTRVKAVLCGDGADELFGGYLAHAAPDAWLRFVRARWARAGTGDWTAAGRASVGAVLDRLAADRLAADAGPRDDGATRARVYRFFLENQLSVGHLERWDHLSMADGLEIRVPYLSLELANLRRRVSWPLLLDPTGGKRILRDVARRVLPAEVATTVVERRKRPFWESTAGLYEAYKRFVASIMPADLPAAHPFRHAFDGAESQLAFDLFALIFVGHRGRVPAGFHARELYAERWSLRDILATAARDAA